MNIARIFQFSKGIIALIAIPFICLPLYYALRAIRHAQESKTERHAKVIKVFDDFDFVGMGEWDDSVDWEQNMNAPYMVETPPHSTEKIPSIDELETNKQYVFHYNDGYEDDFLFKMLKNRLQRNNVSITLAMPLGYPYVGNMTFVIFFEYGKCKGFIFNKSSQNEKDFSKDIRDVDEYILVIEQAD